MDQFSRRIVIGLVFGVLLPKLAWAAACTESPTGQQNCEQFTARDNNALATPLPNYLRLKGNNAAAIAVPTPAAGECIFGDTTATTSTDTFALNCKNGTTLNQVVLTAGTTTAGTAPLKFTAGSLLSTVEAGAMEFWNNAFWLTNLAVRRTIVQGQEVLVANETLANSAAETTMYTVSHGANYLKVGKLEDIELVGTVSSNNGAGTNTLTTRVKYAGSTIGTFVLVEALRSGVAWDLHIMTTVRAIGNGTTSIQVHCNFDLNGTSVDNVVNTLATGLNSTTAEATTVTMQWSDADTGNTISIVQGRALSIDDN